MTQDLDARYQFRLPKELLEAAKAKARQKDILLSQVLRQALRDFVTDRQPLDILEGEHPPKSD